MGFSIVAEMIDYPVATATGRIRRLEDRDGDGRYEHATIFADGLPFPNGVLPCFGGVLVTAAPDILFFRDDDGDGRATRRAWCSPVSARGTRSFGSTVCSWGSTTGSTRPTAAATARFARRRCRRKSGSIRRRDLRFAESGRTTTAVEVEAIAGFSQFGLAHDDWGNRFPSWNTIPIRHVVLEQHALDRNPFLAETSSVAPILDEADGGRVFPISPSSPGSIASRSTTSTPVAGR